MTDRQTHTQTNRVMGEKHNTFFQRYNNNDDDDDDDDDDADDDDDIDGDDDVSVTHYQCPQRESTVLASSIT